MKLHGRLRLVFLFALLSVFCVQGQQSPKPYLLYWTDKDGLCDNTIFRILKDRKGWLWLGTSNGLCRFDGKDFETFRYDPKDKSSVGANSVVRLHETSDGNIWVGTDGGGLSIYNYQTDLFKTIKQNLNAPKNSITEDRIYNFLEDQNDILLGYRAIGSGLGGLTRINLDLQVKAHYLKDEKDYAGFPLKISQSFKDPETADYWLGGRSFFKWNPQEDSFKEFPHPGFVPNFTSINGISRISDSIILVGIIGDGLWAFDTQKEEWQQKIHSLPITAFYNENNERLWLADQKGVGYLSLKDGRFQYQILNENLLPDLDKKIFIYDIEKTGEELWLGTNTGLFCYTELSTQFNNRRLQINKNDFAFFPEFIGTLPDGNWIFMDRKRGLIMTDDKLNFIRLIQMSDNIGLRKATILQTEDNFQVILGTSEGLYHWQQDKSKPQKVSIENAPINLSEIIVWSLNTSDHKVWIGTQKNGLLRWDTKTNQLRQFLHHPTDQASLCHNNYLFEINPDQNQNLWICTDKGISIIDPEEEIFLQYENLDSLQNFVIHCSLADTLGNIWIGTRDQGLYQYHLASNQLSNYSSQDGLLYNGVNELAFCNDRLWLSTRGGLCKMEKGSISGFDKKKGLLEDILYNSRLKKLPNDKVMLTYPYSEYFSMFDGSELQAHFNPPTIILEKLRVLNSENQKSIAASDIKKIRLKSDDNYFAIDFKAIHFFEPRGIRYQYQLEGYDQEWIQSGTNTSAVYTGLPGGSYTFKVQAIMPDNQRSKIQELSIFLATPWNQTAEFYIISCLVLALLIYFFYRYRVNQIRKEENFKRRIAETEMKALRAQINPHFIFNCLNSIKSYIIDNRIEDGTEYVSRFSRLIRLILSHSREKLISIDKEIDAIKLYVWLEQERVQQSFACDFELNFTSSTNDLQIPPLLFQPYIENAIWHGLLNLNRKGRLLIRITEEQQHLKIEIIDDGVGRKVSAELREKSILSKSSLGMELSRQRLHQINELYNINATIEVKDLFSDRSESGTVVKIIFPKIRMKNYA